MQLRVVLKSLLVLFFATIFFFTFAETYYQLFKPVYSLVLNLLADQWDTVTLSITRDQREQSYITATFTSAQGFVFLDYRMPENAQVSTRTLLNYAILHAIILLTMILSWPNRQPREMYWRLLYLLPALLLIEVLDIPTVLYGACLDLLYVNIAPEQLGNSFWVNIMHFFNEGGRLALPVFAALLVIFAARLGATTQNKPVSRRGAAARKASRQAKRS